MAATTQTSQTVVSCFAFSIINATGIRSQVSGLSLKYGIHAMYNILANAKVNMHFRKHFGNVVHLTKKSEVK